MPTCPQCGHAFIARRSTKQFCDDDCRYAWHDARKATALRQEREDGSSEGGTKLDLVKLGLLKEKPAVTPTMRGRATVTTDLNCRQCGKPIRQTRSWRAFCDYSCRMAWHNDRRHEAIERFWAEQATEEPQQETAA